MVTFPSRLPARRPSLEGQWRSLLLINVGTLAAAGLYLLWAPKVYESTFAVRVLVSQPRVIGNVGEPTLASDEQRTLGSEGIDATQVQRDILMSQTVIDELAQRLNILVRDALTLVQARPNGRSNILSVSVRGPSAPEARHNAGLVQRIYLERASKLREAELARRTSTARAALVKADQELAAAARRLARLRAQTGLLDNDTYVAEATRMEVALQQQRIQLVTQLANLQTQVRTLGLRLDTTPENAVLSLRLSNYGPYRTARSDLDQAERQLKAHRSRYTDEHPKVASLLDLQHDLQQLVRERQAETLPPLPPDRKVDGDLDGTRSQLISQLLANEAQSQGVHQQLLRLDEQVLRLKRQLRALPAAQQHLDEARRRLVIAEGFFNNTLAQYQAARLAQMASVPEVRPVDLPNLPEEPVFPKPIPVLVGAVAAGLLGSISLVLWRSQGNLRSPAS